VRSHQTKEEKRRRKEKEKREGGKEGGGREGKGKEGDGETLSHSLCSPDGKTPWENIVALCIITKIKQKQKKKTPETNIQKQGMVVYPYSEMICSLK
jgi:hypothetical protein